MEGLTDWVRVNNHRVFLPPQPLEALVNGISNDIGRTIRIYGSGELGAVDSRYNDDPIFAAFRYLDLDFIFQIILSLFAILFAYDAINGEKERGTLRLSFANAIKRDKYLIGKWLGSFIAVGIPLLIPIIIGSLLLPVLGVHLTGTEWLRLAIVIIAGLLFFSCFLTLSIFISAVTRKSSTSFLLCLVIWIFSVLIIPRISVLLAGRSVDVPSVDELAYQKGKYKAQLWIEDSKKLADFKPKSIGDPMAMMTEFNQYMQELGDKRNKKMAQFSSRLNEQRQNKQTEQERLALGLARISPSCAFSLAASQLAETSIRLKQHFLDEASGYQQHYAQFMKEKTGMNIGSGMIVIRSRVGEEDEEQPIDPGELPHFNYNPRDVLDSIQTAVLDLGLLVLYNILFFAGAFVGFIRYDVR